MPQVTHGSQHAHIWHVEEVTIPPWSAGTAQGIIPRSLAGTSNLSGSTTARMSGSAHFSCSQQVSVPAICCKTLLHVQRVCSYLCSYAGHFQECTMLVNFLIIDAGVGVFYVNLNLESWIKFNSVTIAAAIMTAVFGVGFVYFLYIHARWWGPVVKSVSRTYGPSLKVRALLLADKIFISLCTQHVSHAEAPGMTSSHEQCPAACHDIAHPSAKTCTAMHRGQPASCACAVPEGAHESMSA